MNNNSEVVLFTGGAGFIGANLVKHFLSKNYRIHCLIRQSTNLWRLQKDKKEIYFHKVDINKRIELKRLIESINPTIIINLASYGNTSLEVDIDEAVSTNVIATLNLLFASSEIQYKAFINTGSSSEYGFKNKPMKETDYLEPNSIYSATKASSTYICKVFSDRFNKPIVTLRPFSVYGPYEDKGRLISNIMIAAIKNKPINLSAGSRHDFIYIDDLIAGYVQVIKNIKKASGKIINLGTGIEYTNLEVVKKFAQTSEKKIEINQDKHTGRGWDSSHWVAETTLAKKLINWQAKFSLETGLTSTYHWFIKNINLYE